MSIGWTLRVLGLSSILCSAPAFGQICVPGVLSGEYEFIFKKDNNNPTPWQVTAIEAIIMQCPEFNVEWGAFDLAVSGANGNSNAAMQLFLQFAGLDQSTVPSVENLFSPSNLAPSLTPCPIARETMPIMEVKGGIDLYTFHVGGGGPIEQRATVSLRFCDTVTITSPTAQTIELSFHVSGNVLAAESFGDPNKTIAKAMLKMSGSAGGMAFGPFEAKVESSSVIPAQASINETLSVPVMLQPGVNVFELDGIADIMIEAVAQSTGLFGTLSGAATAAGQFPNSFRIGPFTGSGGAPLPQGITITSASGAVLVGEPACYADCDLSGALDFFDFLCFQNAFANGTAYADCDMSGTLDFFDFLCFQNAFAAGCP